MLITAMLMSAVLSSPPPAGDPDAPQDGVVATAPATPVALDVTAGPEPLASPTQAGVDNLTTDEQIARWLTARAVDTGPLDGAPVWRDDRQPHGEVSVGVGTGGYRDYGVAMSLPVGDNGRLDLSYRQVENGYPHGYGYDGYGYGYEDGYGVGLLGQAAVGPGRRRSSRRALEGYGDGAAAAAERARPWPDIGSPASDRP